MQCDFVKNILSFQMDICTCVLLSNKRTFFNQIGVETYRYIEFFADPNRGSYKRVHEYTSRMDLLAKYSNRRAIRQFAYSSRRLNLQIEKRQRRNCFSLRIDATYLSSLIRFSKCATRELQTTLHSIIR